MNKQQIVQVSISLQELSTYISKFLQRKAGEPVGFALVCATGLVLQHTTNCSKEGSILMLTEMIASLEEKAVIPAHYNPKVRLNDEDEYASWFPIAPPQPPSFYWVNHPVTCASHDGMRCDCEHATRAVPVDDGCTDPACTACRPAAVPYGQERDRQFHAEVIARLVDVARAALNVAENCGDHGDADYIRAQREDVDLLNAALDKLDELPDDQPGVTMTGPAAAAWALRTLMRSGGAEVSTVAITGDLAADKAQLPRCTCLQLLGRHQAPCELADEPKGEAAGVKKTAIAIDAWKLPIFSRGLVAQGYHYTEGPGLTAGTLFLYVQADNLQALAQTVLACNKEAAKQGAPK